VFSPTAGGASAVPVGVTIGVTGPFTTTGSAAVRAALTAVGAPVAALAVEAEALFLDEQNCVVPVLPALRRIELVSVYLDRSAQLGAVTHILAHLECADRHDQSGVGFSKMPSGIPDQIPVVATVFVHVLGE